MRDQFSIRRENLRIRVTERSAGFDFTAFHNQSSRTCWNRAQIIQPEINIQQAARLRNRKIAAPIGSRINQTRNHSAVNQTQRLKMLSVDHQLQLAPALINLQHLHGEQIGKLRLVHHLNNSLGMIGIYFLVHQHPAMLKYIENFRKKL